MKKDEATVVPGGVTRLGTHTPYGLFGRGGSCLRIVEQPSERRDGTMVLALVYDEQPSGERRVLAEFQLDHDAILALGALARVLHRRGVVAVTATNARARAMLPTALDWYDLNQLVGLVGIVVSAPGGAPENRAMARRWKRRLRREMKRLESKEAA